MAGGASLLTGAGVLPVRKAGKLPRRVITETYELEYGVASLEVHEDQLPEGSSVLVIDDVLATGGTALAACRLIERAGWKVAGVAVALELDGLGDHRRQIVAVPDLRQALDGENRDHPRITPPCAASRTASASRRVVRLSFISVRVTCGRT